MIINFLAVANASLPCTGTLLIISAVARRLHVSKLFVGQVLLDDTQAKHARDVLRLCEGASVEVFDDRGASATGTLIFPNGRNAAVKVERVVDPPVRQGPRIIVASAVPKGERADWMVEKLSELGAFAFIPLATERSVVLPAGKSKHERWKRIATESAKQSKRTGVMRIDELTPVAELLGRQLEGIVLTTAPDVPSFAVAPMLNSENLHLFIGPEGGWTDSELESFKAAGIQPARLADTILRIETAAIAATAIAISFGAAAKQHQSP